MTNYQPDNGLWDTLAMLTTQHTEWTRPLLKTNNVLPIYHRWSVSSLPLDGRYQHDNATCWGGISAIDYYHRKCSTNLSRSIRPCVESSKQTDLCRAIPEDATWRSTHVHLYVSLDGRMCWRALQVKCCANSAQVGLMSSPQVPFCRWADWWLEI